MLHLFILIKINGRNSTRVFFVVFVWVRTPSERVPLLPPSFPVDCMLLWMSLFPSLRCITLRLLPILLLRGRHGMTRRIGPLPRLGQLPLPRFGQLPSREIQVPLPDSASCPCRYSASYLCRNSASYPRRDSASCPCRAYSPLVSKYSTTRPYS